MMVNIGLEGQLSSGKSVLMRALAIERKTTTRKILSNMSFSEADEVWSNDRMADFFMNASKDPKLMRILFDYILCIDEITDFLEARNSSHPLNLAVTNCLRYLGKLDCDCLFTYQLRESQVDKRLRELANIFMSCTRINEKGIPLIFEKRVVSYPVFIKVDMELIMHGVIKRSMFIFDPSPFYSGYDTREILTLDRGKYRQGQGHNKPSGRDSLPLGEGIVSRKGTYGDPDRKGMVAVSADEWGG